MRVAFWATTFGADMQHLAAHMVRDSRFDVTIYMADPEVYWRQPIAQILPIERHHILPFQEAEADVLILDNRWPKRFKAKRYFFLWHGYGWLKPNMPAAERQAGIDLVAERLGISPRYPECPLRWNCFSPQDKALRIEEHGYHPDLFTQLGNPLNDALAQPLVSQDEARRLLFAHSHDAPLVLLANTWHYGQPLAHWPGGGIRGLQAYSHFVAQQGANLVVRAHDRDRYPAHIDWGGCSVEYKNESPDNTLAMLAADVMVSNYSSILNYWYYTGRPSIHIEPPGQSYRMRGGRLVQVGAVETPWKTDLTDCGGVIVRNPESLRDATLQALKHPNLCAKRSRDFITRHTGPADGLAAQRIANYLWEWQS